MRPKISIEFVLISIALFIAVVGYGCATLAPGADPFVVRVEQSQSVAKPTFDLILNEDNANRPFWRTNAPAFHNFCGWLRTPMPYQGSNISRVLVIQFNVDDLKLTYKQARTQGNSNALYEAWSVLGAALGQATSWSNIITSPIRP